MIVPSRTSYSPAASARPQHDAFNHLARVQWLDLALLFTLLLLATGLNYMWISVAPYWLVATLAAFILIHIRSRYKITVKIILRARWAIILPWLAYALIILVRDAWSGVLASSFSDRVAYNLAALLLFLTCAVLASRCNWRHVFILIGILGAGFGTIAIGQFVGIDFLWNLPDKISSYSSNSISLENSISTDDLTAGFLGVGRARSLDMFVHKFSSYQGIIAGMISATTVIFWQTSRRNIKTLIMVTVLAMLTVLGVVTTLSRAPLIGLISSLAFTLWLNRSKGTLSSLVMLIFFIGALAVSANFIELTDASKLHRLFEMGTGTENDSHRFESWLYSLQIFAENPLFGGGSGALSGTPLPTHNVPLRILGDFGLIGFFFYAWLWMTLLHTALRTIRLSNKDGAHIGIIITAALIVAVIDNLTHSSGLLQRDVSQPALLGICYGLAIGARFYGNTRTPLRLKPISREWVETQRMHSFE